MVAATGRHPESRNERTYGFIVFSSGIYHPLTIKVEIVHRQSQTPGDRGTESHGSRRDRRVAEGMNSRVLR